MITRIVQLTFQEHLVDEFLKTFEENGPKIRAMKGCHGVDLVQDMYRPYVFFTLSKWESEDDLNAYRESDLFRNTWKVTKSLFFCSSPRLVYDRYWEVTTYLWSK